MAIKSFRFKSTGAFLLLVMLIASPAHAFRCGNKVVTKHMHEQQVRIACGEPTTMRHLGHTVRSVILPSRRRLSSGLSDAHYSGHAYYTEEVVVTEYVYNFGPRKFMRRLVFEGSVLVSIETIGYGYVEKEL